MYNRSNNNYFNPYMQQPSVNPYQNGFYPPYGAVPNPMQTPVQEPPISEIRFLTEDEIKAFIVMPNTKVMLVDKTNGIAVIKSANAMGQSNTRIFDYKERQSDSAPKKQDTQPANDPSPDLKAILDRLDRLEARTSKSDQRTKGDNRG